MPSLETKLPSINSRSNFNQQVCLEENIIKERNSRLIRHLKDKDRVQGNGESNTINSSQYNVMKRKLLSLRPDNISFNEGLNHDNSKDISLLDKLNQTHLPNIKFNRNNITHDSNQLTNTMNMNKGLKNGNDLAFTNKKNYQLNCNRFDENVEFEDIYTRKVQQIAPMYNVNVINLPKTDMKPVESYISSLIYADCAGNEVKGRSKYLKERRKVPPFDKYYWPTVSSWEYGWDSDPEMSKAARKNARKNIIEKTFYASNDFEL